MKVLVLLFTVLMSLHALAGGVGGGGGGTLSRPATPQDIVESAKLHSGFLVKAWLMSQEERFKDYLDDDQRAADPLHKFFFSRRNVYEILATTPIELRTSGPCRDADGNAVDGSVHASLPNAICISAVSMAPKLNKENFEGETAALILHELSHLFGANESEAVEIQSEALSYLKGQLAQEFLEEIRDVVTHETVSQMFALLDRGIRDPLQADVFELSRKLEPLKRLFFDADGAILKFNAYEIERIWEPVGTRLEALGNFVCADSPKKSRAQRASCRRAIGIHFRNDREVTARVYWERWDPKGYYGTEYDAVIVEKPTDLKRDIPTVFRAMKDYLLRIQDDMNKLSRFTLRTY